MPSLQCGCGCDREYLVRQGVVPPETPRVCTFIDGQNLLKCAQRCFGVEVVPYANFDPISLSQKVVDYLQTRVHGTFPNAHLSEIRLYTGVPTHKGPSESDLATFWAKKFNHYEQVSESEPYNFFPVPRELKGLFKGSEKGIDMRLGLDIYQGVINDKFDIAIIFSQDSDHNVALESVVQYRSEHKHWVHIESAFPQPDSVRTRSVNLKALQAQGIAINGLRPSRWFKIYSQTFSSSVDSQDFRATFFSGDNIPFSANFEYVGHETMSSCKSPSVRRKYLSSTPHKSFPNCDTCGQKIRWRRYAWHSRLRS